MSIMNVIQNLMNPQKNNVGQSEQELLNIIDIKGNFLYTRDNYIFTYIKINPINLQLWSDSELQNKWRNYTAEFSSENEEFAIYSFCRPVEMSEIIGNYEKTFKKSEDNMQKYLIQQTLCYLQEISSVGDAIEKQTYIVLWKKQKDYAEKELLKRANDWVLRFENSGSSARILEEQEIIQLINAFTNPSTAFDEEYSEQLLNYNTTFIKLGKEGGN